MLHASSSRPAAKGDRTHTEAQGWLRDLGLALGFEVHVAANDRGRAFGPGRLGDGCWPELPAPLQQAAGADAVRLIDVLWLRSGSGEVAAAFEVEHSTTMYSGIVRLLDLAMGADRRAVAGPYLVAPDAREEDVRQQVRRPAFRGIDALKVRFLPYSELEQHREAMARFGSGVKAIEVRSRDRGISQAIDAILAWRHTGPTQFKRSSGGETMETIGRSLRIACAFALLNWAFIASAENWSETAPGHRDFRKAPRPIVGAMREPLQKLPQIENFEVVGHNPLPNPGSSTARGRNGPIGIAGNCLYVGSRTGRRTGTGPAFGNTALPPEVLIVDISHPRKPTVVGALQTPMGSTSRELRTIADMNTLIVMNFRATGVEGGGGGVPDAPNDGVVNNYQIYDISDCREPRLVSTTSFGTNQPHEFFLWRDPENSSRFLLYSSVLAFAANAEPSLRVFEILGPPTGTMSQVASFTLSPAVPFFEPVTDPAAYRDDHFVFAPKPTTQRNNLHSMSVSSDGSRVYMSNSQAGFFILDSSRLARRVPCTPDTVTMDDQTNTDPSLCLRKVNPDPSARIDLTPPYGGQHHSIYPVPGRPYLVTGGERNGTDTCPWTWGSILDMSDERNLQFVARFMVPENLAHNCFTGGPGDPALMREFSTHHPLVFANIFFISWYSAGLRAWDISNPALPLEVGVFAPRPVARAVERFRDSPDVWVWPMPILRDGLLYIADENSGLYVLKYTGPRADELPRHGSFQSNQNY